MRKAFSTLLLAGAALVGLPAALAQPEPFGPDTWAELRTQVRGPTWVVFSAADCSHCPAVMLRLQREHPQIPLWWIHTDASDPAPAPTPVAREFSFGEGHKLALQYSVHPQWKGMTPYLALLRPGQPPLFALAQPSPMQEAALKKAPKNQTSQ